MPNITQKLITAKLCREIKNREKEDHSEIIENYEEKVD